MRTVREAMCQFVYHDVCIERAVEIRAWRGPEIHLHYGTRSISRCSEVCVVCAAAILCLGRDAVAARPAAAKIVFLEIASGFGETQTVKLIMVPICYIKQLRDDRVLKVGRNAGIRLRETSGRGLTCR